MTVDGAWIVLAFILGLGIAWMAQSVRLKSRSEREAAEKERLESDKLSLAQEKAALEARSAGLEKDLGETKTELNGLREESTGLHRKLAGANERIQSMEERLREQKKELEETHKRLTAEFETLANRILESNTQKFVSKNKESLDKLLLPLSEKIVAFRERVDKTHDQGVKDRAQLLEQVKSLSELNQVVSEETKNLTTALKGQAKTQGNWGEMILESVLQKSGLMEGQEYVVQSNLKGEDGKRYQPDVVINLPENRHLVVDAKVSLVGYERCVNSEDSEEKASALKDHLLSIKNHVSALSQKRYDALYDIQSPDFTLMFVPVEPAFTLAMQSDDTLFDHAFRQNVVIVTPSTLLATLRTVASIWRQEKQTRNALDIAQRSGALYDKFVGFFEDMAEIGLRIDKSHEAYESAMNKLKTGRGNLVNQVQTLHKLGAKAKKALPEDVVEQATESFSIKE